MSCKRGGGGGGERRSILFEQRLIWNVGNEIYKMRPEYLHMITKDLIKSQ